MNVNKKAVTLVEVLIVVAISASILIVIMNLFSSGMKGSVKGLAHQANMEAASIIMSQIEYDLLRATKLEHPVATVTGDFDNVAKWNLYNKSGKISTVNYTSPSGIGVKREVETDGNTQSYVFAKDKKVDLKFKHFRFQKEAMLIKLTVSSKDSKKIGSNPEETFSLSRLIVIRGI